MRREQIKSHQLSTTKGAVAFSTMDSFQISRLALISLRQTPRIPSADLLLIHMKTTLHATSSTQESSELSKQNMQIMDHSIFQCVCFSSWRRGPVFPQRTEQRWGGESNERKTLTCCSCEAVANPSGRKTKTKTNRRDQVQKGSNIHSSLTKVELIYRQKTL